MSFPSLPAASMQPPEFTERLHTREVKEGAAVKFSVKVKGKPAPEVTWYREGSQIVSSPDFEIQQHGDVHSLYIPEVFYEDSGKFTVRLDNQAGHTSCTAELIVEGRKQMLIEAIHGIAHYIHLHLLYFSSFCTWGVCLTFSCVEKPKHWSLPWQRSHLHSDTDHSTEARHHTYQETSSVHQGRSSLPPSPFPVYHQPIIALILLLFQPLANQKAREGERVTLQCTIPPYPLPERVQWFKNEIEIKPSPDYQISFHNGVCTLTIVEVFPEDAGKYVCTVYIQGLPNSTFMYLTVERKFLKTSASLSVHLVSICVNIYASSYPQHPKLLHLRPRSLQSKHHLLKWSWVLILCIWDRQPTLNAKLLDIHLQKFFGHAEDILLWTKQGGLPVHLYPWCHQFLCAFFNLPHVCCHSLTWSLYFFQIQVHLWPIHRSDHTDHSQLVPRRWGRIHVHCHQL